MSQDTKPPRTNAGARVDAEQHRALLQQLFVERRSFRQWLECQERRYLRHRAHQKQPA